MDGFGGGWIYMNTLLNSYGLSDEYEKSLAEQDRNAMDVLYQKRVKQH